MSRSKSQEGPAARSFPPWAGLYPRGRKSGQVWVRTPGREKAANHNGFPQPMSGGLKLRHNLQWCPWLRGDRVGEKRPGAEGHLGRLDPSPITLAFSGERGILSARLGPDICRVVR